MVWIVTYNDVDNGDSSVAVWDDYTAALKDVCANIVDDINGGGYDLSDPDTLLAFQEIDNHMRLMQWHEAMIRWNEWSCDSGTSIYWSVLHETMFSKYDAKTPGSIVWSAPIQASTNVVITPTLPPSFIPITNGATCRGPCGQYNSYASADQADGTHLCYACKAMSNFCGGKVI